MAIVLDNRVKQNSTTSGTVTLNLNATVPTGFISFGVGNTLDVFCTLPSSKAVYLDENGDAVGAAGPGFAVAMAIAL